MPLAADVGFVDLERETLPRLDVVFAAPVERAFVFVFVFVFFADFVDLRVEMWAEEEAQDLS